MELICYGKLINEKLRREVAGLIDGIKFAAIEFKPTRNYLL